MSALQTEYSALRATLPPLAALNAMVSWRIEAQKTICDAITRLGRCPVALLDEINRLSHELSQLFSARTKLGFV